VRTTPHQTPGKELRKGKRPNRCHDRKKGGIQKREQTKKDWGTAPNRKRSDVLVLGVKVSDDGPRGVNKQAASCGVQKGKTRETGVIGRTVGKKNPRTNTGKE